LPQVETNQNKCYSFGNQPTLVNKTGEWRFLTPNRQKGLSPCRQGCLLDGDIPAWLEAVKREDWPAAWQIMKEYNPFPALTGYVCFHPCSESCNRGELDQAIDIREVEKALGHWRLDNYSGPVVKPVEKGKIAIVGSGPAGLSCAYYLNNTGYRVTVFEKSEKIGGMLALGIPEYRLPRRILNQELEILVKEGVSFKNKAALGIDYNLHDLCEQFDQVFLATGAWISRIAGIDGEDNGDVWNALDFLAAYNDDSLPDIKGPVVVVGGGNAAIDSARSALRLPGVHQVSLVYRRSRAEMPADQAEVEAAEGEGVELIFNAAPDRACSPMSKVPPSPASTTTVVSRIPLAFKPRLRPLPTEPALGKGQCRIGHFRAVRGGTPAIMLQHDAVSAIARFGPSALVR